jgi:hypothetical protein
MAAAPGLCLAEIDPEEICACWLISWPRSAIMEFTGGEERKVSEEEIEKDEMDQEEKRA